MADRLRSGETPGEAQLVIPLESYIGRRPNYRIDGFRILRMAGLPTPSPIFVIPHEGFELFKESPDLFFQRIQSVLQIPGEQAAQYSKKRSIALRRAFEIPNLANPPGPSFMGVQPGDLGLRVADMFSYAQKNFDIQDADIACFFYPFIDPENKPLKEIQPGDKLPYGGWVYPLSDDGNRFKIEATWGNNQTLIEYGKQGLPRESYYVSVDPQDCSKIKIYRKHIPQKRFMHYTSSEGRNAFVEVPPSHQFEQVMYDSEIVSIAQNIPSLMQTYGPHRLEFSSDGESIFFNELIDMAREVKEPEVALSREAKIFTVSSLNDLERLKQLQDVELSGIIIFASDRDPNSVTNPVLAETFKGKGLVIFYSGDSDTAHAMKIFADNGHFAFPTGRIEFKHGDRVKIEKASGHPAVIENLTLEQDEITSLDAAYKKGVPEVGGKAERLSVLKSEGFTVPDGLVITTDFYDQVLQESGVREILESMGSIANAEVVANQIKQSIHIPESLWQKIAPLLERFDLLSGNKELIARSSANVEDLRGGSFAGMFESIPHLRTEEEIRDGVLDVIRSVFTPKVVGYLKGDIKRLSEIKMAVLIQEMVDAQVSGTLFGWDQTARDNSVVVIETKRGLAQGIVDGEAVDQKVMFKKESGEITHNEGMRIINDSQQFVLFQLAMKLEEKFGYPQDIEWAIDGNGQLWIVQSRDI